MLVPAAGIVGCKMLVNEHMHKLRYVLGARTYARMYVCMYIRTYVRTHARTYVHTRASMHALTKTGMDIIKVRA